MAPPCCAHDPAPHGIRSASSEQCHQRHTGRTEKDRDVRQPEGKRGQVLAEDRGGGVLLRPGGAANVKYTQASAARVTLRPDRQYLVFTVEDDGQGFDQANAPRGTGLQGISDRLGALGGTINITSAPDRGTQVTGRVPAAAR